MICKKCGAELLEGARFCTVCGTANEVAPVQEEKTQYMFADNTVTEPVAPAEPVAPVYEAPQQYAQPAAPVYEAPQQYAQPAAPVYEAPQQYAQPGLNGAQTPFANVSNENLSEEEFFERFADKNVKSNYKWSMIICFITAAISIPFLVLGNVIAVLDIILFGVLGFLMLKKKNWIFPLIASIYGGICSVIGLATSGTPSGVVALICAIMATIGAKKVHDAYVQYKTTGAVPMAPIGGKK